MRSKVKTNFDDTTLFPRRILFDFQHDFNVEMTSDFDVFTKSMTRRCKDVGFNCRHEFNVVITSHFDALTTSMTRRCKDVVYMLSDVRTYIEPIIDLLPKSCTRWDVATFTILFIMYRYCLDNNTTICMHLFFDRPFWL